MADLVIALRPIDGSATAIAAAIERARVAQSDADDAVTVAQREHDEALLDAPEGRLQDLERKLDTARSAATRTSKRISAMLVQLEARLVTAKRNEAVARLVAARGDAEKAGTCLAAWWEENRAKLAAILREGEALDTALGRSINQFANIVRDVGNTYPDVDTSYPQPTHTAAFRWRDEVDTMTKPVPVARVYQLTPEEEAQAAAQTRREQLSRDTAPDGFNPVLLRRA